jgi:hypothetical protein
VLEKSGINIEVPAEVTQENLRFLQRILGPAAEAADFLSDKIKFWRWQSALRTLDRARTMALDANIRPSEVPLKFLVPFLEKSSLEYEDGMQERWAHLLLSASTTFDGLHNVYLNLLSMMSSEEAGILSKMYQASAGNFISGIDAETNIDAGTYTPAATDGVGVNRYGTLVIFIEPMIHSEEHLEHLIQDTDANRLLLVSRGLESRGLVRVSMGSDDIESHPLTMIWANLTALGRGFVETCEGMS